MSYSHKSLPLLFLYFLSSSSLLVLNKIAISAIPNAALLLFVQLLSTVLIVLVKDFLEKQKTTFIPSLQYVRAYASVAFVFLATIYSNFHVIHAIGVNSFIVLRCSTPLMVSVLDWLFMGRTLPQPSSLFALVGIAVSASMYAHLKFLDPSATRTTDEARVLTHGLCWSVLWTVSFLLDMVYIKFIIEAYPCSNSERTIYQNFLALPFLLVLMAMQTEAKWGDVVLNATPRAYLAVISTCIAGAVLSFTGMSLRSEYSATFFTVLGIICKMASTLLNELFVEPEGDVFRLLCIAAVILSSAFYRQAPLKCSTASV